MKKIIPIFMSFVLVLTFSVFVFQNQALAQNSDRIKLKVFIHYPGSVNKGKPSPPSCPPTTNDQVQDFNLIGWHMPTTGLTYKINLSSKPKNLKDSTVLLAVSQSFATWTTADAKQIFNYNGSATGTAGKYDGVNLVTFQRLSSTAIAITYTWWDSTTGNMLETDTAFNSNYSWSYTSYNGTNDCGGVRGTYDLQNIGTHEFGHWVGLNDLYNTVDKDLTMYGYGYLAELKADSLGKGDILGVNTVAP